MKKTLALVLALMMVLALVPTAFAAVASNVSSDSYKVTVTYTSKPIGSMDEEFKSTFEASGKVPSVNVALPYGAINDATNNGDIWADSLPTLQISIAQFGGAGTEDSFAPYHNDVKVYINGEDKTKDVTWSGRNLGFSTTITKANASYSYDVKVVGSDAAGNTMTEQMRFVLNYTNTTKPVYDLKFGQPDTDGVVLKDGVYFIDSENDNVANIPEFLVTVLKNDGSKFTENAYWSTGATDYKDLDKEVHLKNKVNADSQMIVETAALNGNNLQQIANTSKKAYVTIETKYAFYKGVLTYKYRTNVEKVDPKGISFAQDTYTIGVNEVLNPSYKTIVDVYYDIASDVVLTVTSSTELNVIDVEGNKITGLKEGTAYVRAAYAYSPDHDSTGRHATVYTDTAKIIVKGTYQVTDKANYIVTTSSSNLNVRSGAGTKYSKIGSLAKGTVVEVVEIKDGWAKIIFPSANYTNGYVSAQYLTKQGTSPETVIGTKTVIARVLNVRSGAGTSYSIVGKLNRNTKVEVIETVANGSWSKIKFNGGYAYVSSTYIQ